MSYEITPNTIVLDREGLLGYPNAIAEPEEAFEKINKMAGNVTLLVAPSVYWLDDPDDPAVRSDKGGTPYAIRIKCDSLSVIGLSGNPEDVIFAVNRGQTQGAVGNFTMFRFSGISLTTQNITFGNYCNVDLEYKRNSIFNRKKRKDAIVQAQIGICDGTDRLFAQNCRFISRLNLCPFVGARRSLYDNCYFECTDDALSGSAIYLDCRFTFFSSKPFYSTAETGAIFLNCDITCLGSGEQYFTKMPGQVTVIDTRFFCDNPIDIKWTRDASDIICRQENVTLNGKPYVIDADRLFLGPQLSESKLRNAYVVDYEGMRYYNLPNLLNGIDGWDPKDMNSVISDIASNTDSKLTGIPVALRITSDAPKFIFDGDSITVRSTPLLWGGYPAGNDDIFTFTAENDLPAEKKVEIPVSTLDGLAGRHSITIEPKLRKAPKFKKKPVIKFDEKSKGLLVDYSLSGKGDDISGISWCRISNDGNNLKVITISESDAPKGRFYVPKAGDLGYGIAAIVFPQYKDSQCGMPDASPVYEITDSGMVDEFPESHLFTDFSDVPIWTTEPGIPGIWNFDVFKPYDTSNVDWEAADGPGWYYGKGFDASTGVGLVQSEKGARMSYVPARDICRDMDVSIVAEPAKSAGQGFGSATSQYMDICIKFDPIDLNGYALRIERTPDHDRAVSFSLIKYEDGKTSVISDEVISNCFRTPCHIAVGIADGVLHASAYTEANRQDRKCCDEVVDKVELSAPVEENYLTGFCIQHTGSTGPSSTLIRNIDIRWD
ncbi:MAG: hypothetical protein K2L45_08245 [Muribaculaceae bacterium]|nr:hypothetical protein [Muribaculaceae bacterium]